MKKRRIRLFKYILTVMTMLVLVTAFFPKAVQARGAVDLTKKGSLELTYKYNGDGANILLPGVTLNIYRVASIDAVGEYTLLSPYNDPEQFPVTDLNQIKNQDSWDELVTSIWGYIYTNKITPDASGISDENGKVKLEDLELGIYLVVSDTLKQTDCTYTFRAFFTSIPGLDADGNWINSVYDIIGVPKCERTLNPTTVSYSLYKRWVDTGYESSRPSSIAVDLYLDGALFRTVTLSDANAWTYSWEYEDGHTWTIAEHITGSYSAALSESGTSFILTNTHTTDTPPDNPPDNPPWNTPPSSPPSTPVTPAVAGAVRTPAVTPAAVTPDVLGASRLPQTGQLWWPVPVLALAGMLLFGIGWYKEHGGKNETHPE